MLVWFLPLFLLFLLIGLPVFFGLLAAPGILLWLNDQARDGAMLYRNIYNGIDSFPLMAIPFFMLAGELMNRGGITHRLVEFSQAMMGHLKGGLAHVNVLTSMLDQCLFLQWKNKDIQKNLQQLLLQLALLLDP